MEFGTRRALITVRVLLAHAMRDTLTVADTSYIDVQRAHDALAAAIDDGVEPDAALASGRDVLERLLVDGKVNKVRAERALAVAAAELEPVTGSR